MAYSPLISTSTVTTPPPAGTELGLMDLVTLTSGWMDLVTVTLGS
jgi:hypothetical protein